jgi:hypothetical protein
MGIRERRAAVGQICGHRFAIFNVGRTGATAFYQLVERTAISRIVDKH